MKGLIVAIQFLTRLPTPRLTVSGAEFAASMRWFPAVGLILGGLIAGAAWLGMRIDPWVGTLMALTVWTGVTGALHLDGLGDIADAGGAAHKDRERLLAVLADPHVGSFGTVAITLQLLAKLVLLHALLDRGLLPTLVLVPFAARVAPLIWTISLPPLHQGLGARFRGAIRPFDLAPWAIALAIAAWFAPAVLAILPFILAWGCWLRHRIGGISGDGHGAGIELAETALLFALIAWHRLA
ncbi:MAG: adenosylcobinamide-GDP ribazoletransferase [Novosphingobium sp.]